MCDDILIVKCDYCGSSAEEPYIECCECETNLCTHCFSNGREIRSHKNYHNYAVRRNDFPLFDSCNWSAKEEGHLLSALTTFGYGNWEDIAKAVVTRSKLECQEHYKKYYIENVQHKDLDLVPHTQQSMYPKPIVPYLYSTDICHNPPRNNPTDQHLAGYNAYRSEFELNYDQNTESLFHYGDVPDDSEENELLDHLKLSLVNALNNRLLERKRRYDIIKAHGLIMPNKLISWLQRFDKTLTRARGSRLLSFMQFMTGMQFDAFMESLSLEGELSQKVLRYREYRKVGVKSMYGVQLYEAAKREHDIVKKEQKSITYSMIKKFDFNKANLKRGIGNRKTSYTTPLDIVDLPGFHLLSDREADLCSCLRILPRNYLTIKEAIIGEFDKLGCVTLSDARKVSKIDVNKTRKIYDMMADEGFIVKKIVVGGCFKGVNENGV